VRVWEGRGARGVSLGELEGRVRLGETKPQTR
jgi:hypothetical protein